MRNRSAVDLSRRILRSCNNELHQLARMSIADLCQVEGIGTAKAVKILASLEFGSRSRQRKIDRSEPIGSSKDAYLHLAPLISNKSYEEFWILLMRQNNTIIRSIRVSEGGLTGTVADPKRIFKTALEHGASALILCHNHPSGNLNPSQADIRITQKLTKAGQLLDIRVLDHLIITAHDYYSMADHDLF